MARDNRLWAKHGLCDTPIYSIHAHMMARCYNPNAAGFKNYGGRGIVVCRRWHDVKNFYNDMGKPPSGMLLDRKDNNGHYEPSNCRWATRTEQNNNTRSNITLSYSGRSLTVSQWARELGMKPHTIRARYHRGLSVDRVLQTEYLAKNQWTSA
jgi:hypothetical protein